MPPNLLKLSSIFMGAEKGKSAIKEGSKVKRGQMCRKKQSPQNTHKLEALTSVVHNPPKEKGST